MKVWTFIISFEEFTINFEINNVVKINSPQINARIKGWI